MMTPALSRRALLRQSTAALSLPAVFAQSRDDRPNIFFAIADDHSWIHTAAAGDPVVRTPTMDRVARAGVTFNNSYCSSPSCTPSRAAVLTGQQFWRLKESANLWSTLRKNEFPVYPDLLEAAGYETGLLRKGWGPGSFEAGGFTRNPAGPGYKSFADFMQRLPGGKPFCFWFGTSDPHRPYTPGTGAARGMNLRDIRVPAFLPDSPEVRSDIADYLFEVERWDRELGEALDLMEKSGRLDNTLVVITSDNGMPFPRAKCNLYDYGVRMPCFLQWRARVKGDRVIDDFISHTDFAPTFLEACGLKPPAAATGRSLLPLLAGARAAGRGHVLVGRERHTAASAGSVGYPMRAIRSHSHLLIRNYETARWPASDPERYGDIDGGPTKSYLLDHRDTPAVKPLFDLACAKRPPVELYSIKDDPFQMRNLAGQSAHRAAEQRLLAQLQSELKRLADPRETGGPVPFDTYPYHGRRT
jgi:uncharacterized sulfatase